MNNNTIVVFDCGDVTGKITPPYLLSKKASGN